MHLFLSRSCSLLEVLSAQHLLLLPSPPCFLPSSLPSPQQKPEVDFESLLQQLSTAIQDKQQRLSEIKLRERRTTLLFTVYAFGSWMLYAGLWWLNVLPLGLIGFGGSQEDGEESSWEDGLGGVIVLALPAVVGPFG